jgi:hypothetical protein
VALLRSLLAVVTLVSAPAAGLAQESPVPPEVDKVLWCASAFYWLAGSAEDSGDAAEAEMYDRWSQQLLDTAAQSLTARATPPDTIEALITSYDERVLGELSTDATPAYDVANCATLLSGMQ